MLNTSQLTRVALKILGKDKVGRDRDVRKRTRATASIAKVRFSRAKGSASGESRFPFLMIY
jgi:hypothetical protein